MTISPPLHFQFAPGGCEVWHRDRSVTLECPTRELFVARETFSGCYPLPLNAYCFLKGMPVVDIGAHVGCTAIYWSLLLEPSVVHAYEPGAVALSHLRKNVEQFPVVRVFAEAVGSSTGCCQFYPSSALCLGTTIPKPWSGESHAGFCVSAEEALRRIDGEIGVLKVDAEESEAEILANAADELDRVRMIFVEHHGEDLRRDVDDVLRAKGFLLFHGDYQWTRGVSGYVNQEYALSLYDEDDLRAQHQNSKDSRSGVRQTG